MGREWEVAVSGGEGIYMPGRIYMYAIVHIYEAESRRPRGGPSWTGDGTGDGVYMREHIRAR